MLEIGSLVDGKYRILRVVGKGGMSVVYQAVNEKANKIWAIKEVRKDGVQNFEVVKQNLVVETDLLKRLNHPNLPSIIDVIDGEGSFLIVMDYIEGNSLNKALETDGAQSQDDVIEWSKQLCDVLGYLHSRKPPIIYRDMKPANVMLKPDGNVSLIDFGTAREFKSTSVEDTTCLGTQGYAAPEQYGGHGQTDARTDIYCLGATMYHLVTGHNPSTPPYEMYPIRQWNPLLSSGLEQIIIKCTQRNPADRYQNCAELLYDLDHYQDMDIENRKIQRVKWNAFIASLIAMFVMLIGTVGFSIAGSAVKSNTYEALVKEGDNYAESAANSTEDKEQAEKKYVEAITKVDPGNIDAYNKLLELYMKDKVLDSTEYTKIKDYIVTNESALKDRDEDKYINELIANFANDLFFSFETKSGTSSTGIGYSKNWYKKISESGVANQKNKFLAENLGIIAENYNDIGRIDSGNESLNFTEYWDKLNTLLDQDLVGNGNILIALRMYRFVASELEKNVDSWKLYNIPLDSYIDAFKKIKAKTDAITSNGIYETNKAQLETYVENINDFYDHALKEGYGFQVKTEGAGN